MRLWVKDQIPVIPSGIVILLDPDGALSSEELADLNEVEKVDDWYSLRRTYEQRARRRPSTDPPIFIVVEADCFRRKRDLPVDIERDSSVVSVDIPVSGDLETLAIGLEDELSDRLVKIAAAGESGQEVIDRLLADVWGLVMPHPGSIQELSVALRLHVASVPPILRAALSSRFTTALARGLMHAPPDVAPLQIAWNEWLQEGAKSKWDEVMRATGTDLLPLLLSGQIQAAPLRADRLPQWARIGSSEASPQARILELLALQSDLPVSSTEDWLAIAEWWGNLRAEASLAPGDVQKLREKAWTVWEEVDSAFDPVASTEPRSSDVPHHYSPAHSRQGCWFPRAEATRAWWPDPSLGT